MKKSFYIALLLLIISISIFILTGCSNKTYKLAQNNIAEIRKEYFVGKNDIIHASFMSGMREENYIINGISTSLIPFGVLTFNFLKQDEEINNIMTFIIMINDKKYEDELQKNPYDNSFVADIQKEVKGNSKIIAKLINGDKVYEIELINIKTNWKVNHSEALKIACKAFKKDIEKIVENNQLKGEVYVRIINNGNFNDEKFFWYVNFVSQSGNSFAVIIDPLTKEILAKR